MYVRRSTDLNLLGIVVLLSVLGVLMVFSASFVRAQQIQGDPYFYLKRQGMWLVVGIAAMLFASQIQYWHWRKFTRPLLTLSAVTLLLALIPGIGDSGGGSQRWISLGFLSFQPSELAKLALVLYSAIYLSKMQGKLKNFRHALLPYLATVGAITGLVVVQDLGTAVAIAGTVGLLLFVAGAPLLHLAGLGLASLPVVGYLIFSEGYRARRIFAFLDPMADPQNAGYQIIQSLYALGSGGLFGVGFFEGRQKFFYLPAQHTDFIFAVLGEELGFLGTLAVLLLFGALAWRGYRIAVAAPDTYACLMAAGITTMVLLQALINIGVVTASMPITGIPLPFLSYGGSSLVFSLLGIGIVLNISRHVQS